MPLSPSWIRHLCLRPRVLLALLAMETIGIAALSLGAGLIYGTLIRPLPFTEPDRLVHLWGEHRGRGWRYIWLSYPEFEYYRDQNRVLASLAAFDVRSATLGRGERAERVRIAEISPSLPATLGLRMTAGRAFSDSEDMPVALLSEHRWRARHGADPAAVGSMIWIDGIAHHVLGVAPRSLYLQHFFTPIDAFVPLRPRAAARAAVEARHLMALGRIAHGVDLEAARAEVLTLSQRFAAMHPQSNEGHTANLYSLLAETTRNYVERVTTVGVAAALLGLAITVNSLLIRIAEMRRRKTVLAVRMALGARPVRIIAVELFGGAIVASLAVAFGALLSAWGAALLKQYGREFFPRVDELALEWRALALAVVAVCLPTVLGTCLAIARLLRQDGMMNALQTRAVGETRASRTWTRALVGAQAALATVLLGVGGLLALTSWELDRVPLGFNPDRLLTMRLVLPEAKYESAESRSRFFASVLEEHKAVPGVETVSLVNYLPVSRQGTSRFIDVIGSETSPSSQRPADYRVIASTYFRAMGIPLLHGAVFEDTPTQNGLARCLVNQAFVSRFLGTGDPLGRVIRIGAPPADVASTAPLEGLIVGVVGDVRHWGPDRSPRPEVYVSYRADPPRNAAIVFRTRTQDAAPIRALIDGIRWVDPDQPVFDVRTMDAVARDFVQTRRVSAFAVVFFAAAAALTCGVGIYGMVLAIVLARRRDFAVRLAFGASRQTVGRLALREGLLPVAAGAVVGLGGSLWAGHLIRTLLFAVQPYDARAVLAALGVILAMALLACWPPVREARRADPISLLRAE